MADLLTRHLLTLSRESLDDARVEVLSRGGSGNPDVLRVPCAGGSCVVKDFSVLGRRWRWLAGWLARRELRAYRQLADHPAVPQVLARIDGLAFAIEYRPGEILGPRLARWVPPSFIADLDRAVAGMHERGVVHLDLRHRSNALADADGRPVLIDFGSALCFTPGSLSARWILPTLAWIDRRAIRKWERQLASEA